MHGWYHMKYYWIRISISWGEEENELLNLQTSTSRQIYWFKPWNRALAQTWNRALTQRPTVKSALAQTWNWTLSQMWWTTQLHHNVSDRYQCLEIPTRPSAIPTIASPIPNRRYRRVLTKSPIRHLSGGMLVQSKCVNIPPDRLVLQLCGHITPTLLLQTQLYEI